MLGRILHDGGWALPQPGAVGRLEERTVSPCMVAQIIPLSWQSRASCRNGGQAKCYHRRARTSLSWNVHGLSCQSGRVLLSAVLEWSHQSGGVPGPSESSLMRAIVLSMSTVPIGMKISWSEKPRGTPQDIGSEPSLPSMIQR